MSDKCCRYCANSKINFKHKTPISCYCDIDNTLIPICGIDKLYCDEFKPRQELRETWSEDGKSCDVWVEPERIEPLPELTEDITIYDDIVDNRKAIIELQNAVNAMRKGG